MTVEVDGEAMRIYDLNGIEIQVWPADHRPVHCHVIIGECHFRVFLPELTVEPVGDSPLPPTRLIKQILDVVQDHKGPIGRAWRKFHGN